MDDSVSARQPNNQPPPRRTAPQTKVSQEEMVDPGQERQRLESWRANISAKEKTGVDPLSQVIFYKFRI